MVHTQLACMDLRRKISLNIHTLVWCGVKKTLTLLLFVQTKFPENYSQIKNLNVSVITTNIFSV